ncbi:inositol monophosphatase [Chloropicon primus]|nr:inositol monophosphatase [Chloropicon primus]
MLCRVEGLERWQTWKDRGHWRGATPRRAGGREAEVIPRHFHRPCCCEDAREGADYRDKAAQVAIEAVRKACVLGMRMSELAGGSGGKAVKDDLSPVTIADYAIQSLIEQELSEKGLLSDGTPLIAEEDAGNMEFDATEVGKLVNSVVPTPTPTETTTTTEAEDEDDARKQRWWILDPIDGTKGLVSPNLADQYVIGLCLVEEGQPVVGVMGLPNWAKCDLDEEEVCGQGILIAAQKGRGTVAMAVDEDGEGVGASHPGELVSVDGSRTFEEATLLMSKSQDFFDDSLLLGRAYRGRKPKKVLKACCGSLVKYAAVALGLCSLYIEHPVKGKEDLKVWDHASGVLCVTEAGGTVSDLGGDPLFLGKTPCSHFRPGGLGVICSNGRFHPEVVSKLGAEVDR